MSIDTASTSFDIYNTKLKILTANLIVSLGVIVKF